MRREQYVSLAAVANLANKLDHSLPRRRIKPVGRLIEKDQSRPVDDRLRKLRKLFHSKRIRSNLAIARFAQPYVEQGFVRPFERRFRRQTRKLSHQTNEVNTTHVGDERVAFGHVADLRSNLLCVAADVAAEDMSRARGRRMEAKQRVNQRGLARAVRSQQPDCSSA